jgi:hypothetical protein
VVGNDGRGESVEGVANVSERDPEPLGDLRSGSPLNRGNDLLAVNFSDG